MTLKTIPEIQTEMQLLYKQWRVGNISRFQLAAGTSALQGMAKMVKDEFEVQAQRAKLNLDANNQRQAGGAILIPVDVTLEEFHKLHKPGTAPQATLEQIKHSDEYKQRQFETMAAAQAELVARDKFFTCELENIDATETPNLIEELERRYAEQKGQPT